MGIYMSMGDTHFHIKEENWRTPDCQEILSLLEAIGYEPIYEGVYDSQGSLIKPTGDIIDITFVGEYYHWQEQELFSLIAKYVEPGCYLEIAHADGTHFRYAFTGKRMIEQEPRYDDIPIEDK